MRMELEVPDYDRHLAMHWDAGFEIRVTQDDSEVHIQANRPGLISFARLNADSA